MKKTPDDIRALFRELEDAQSPEKAMARRISDAYGNRIVLPLPELDRNEQYSVANLMAQGIEGHGQRIGSLMPEPRWPALRPGIKRSEEFAEIRRKANLGWWERNTIDVKMGKRGRWYVAYAMSPVVIRWHPGWGCPEWQLRDPLTTFPAETSDPTDVAPPYVLFSFSRPLSWIKRRYPEAMSRLRLGPMPKPSDRYELLEYVDDEQLTMLVLGKKADPHAPAFGGTQAEVLEDVVNPAGYCPAVVPGRISLDERSGKYDRQLGMFHMRAKLFALQLIAVQRGVLPETYAVAETGTAKVVPADAMTGAIGTVTGGKLETIRPDPSFANLSAIDRLEASERMEGGVPADWTGQSATNVRTARRGDAILGQTVDYDVEEAQRQLARSMEHENKVAVAVAKAYSGDSPRSFYVGWKNARGKVDYTPNVHFETDENRVRYPFAGADVNTLTQTAGSLTQMKAMSRRRLMELHPLVDDVERETDLVTAELIDDAGLAALQQQAANGEIPPADVARIKQLVVAENLPWEEAVLTVQREAQERQATPVPAGSPEAQPGLSMPGMGAEAPVEAAGGTASVTDLASLLGRLRQPQVA